MSSKEQDRIESLTLPAFMSPYRLAKVESSVRGKVIPPQKLYGYVRQGYIKTSLNSTGKVQVAKEEAIRYLKTQAK